MRPTRQVLVLAFFLACLTLGPAAHGSDDLGPLAGLLPLLGILVAVAGPLVWLFLTKPQAPTKRRKGAQHNTPTPRPDVEPLARKQGAADAKAGEAKASVAKALAPKSPDDPNPHGLADATDRGGKRR